MDKIIKLPFDTQTIDSLHVGDTLLLSGDILVLRDAGHRRLMQDIDDKKCPIELAGALIYYMAPTPAKDGEIIGSCGPTTSMRMDSFTPWLYDLGIIATIGKGERSVAVKNSIIRNHALYLAAIGGAGALYKSCVVAIDTLAYKDLGAEALLRLTVRDFPVIVAIDSYGGDIYNK